MWLWKKHMIVSRLMSERIDVGKVFHPRLLNRDKNDRDGKHNAIDFKRKYLNELDRESAWLDETTCIVVLDFSNVERIGPSFAHEAFAYFTKYATHKQVLNKIRVVNATSVQMSIIKIEFEIDV